MDKVLILGGNGFVGSAVAQWLATHTRFIPVIASRRRSNTSVFEERVCDATERDSVIAAARGVAYVVDCVLGDAATMQAATRNVCHAVETLSLRGAVLSSSMAVYGPVEGVVREDAALDGSLGWYGAAKVACEGMARGAMQTGVPIAILRPGIVYGPGGEQWIGRTARLLQAGRCGDLGPAGDGLCNLIYKDDIGKAVAAVLMRAEAGADMWGQAFNLAECEPGTWNDFFGDLAVALRLPSMRRLSRRRLTWESAIMAPPLQAMKLAARRVGIDGRHVPDAVPPSLVRLWGQRIRLDARRTDSVLGFARTERGVGLSQSAQWFLARHAALRQRSDDVFVGARA